MTAIAVPTLITPGVIATRLGVPHHRVAHILATRAHIRPTARAGTLRLYDEASLDAVRVEIEQRKPRRRETIPTLRIASVGEH